MLVLMEFLLAKNLLYASSTTLQIFERFADKLPTNR